MTYISHVPSPPLNTYIDDLYYVDGSAPYPRLKIFPMPSLHLMVNLGDAFRVHTLHYSQPFATCTESWWVGLWSRYHLVDWPQNIKFFGVHFKPGGAYPFLRLPLAELHNQVVPLDALWGKAAAEIREQLAAAPTIQAGFSLVERILLARLCQASAGLDMVQSAILEIARCQGALPIRALCEQISISQSYLGAQFKRMVGISPKELARFYRFANVLRSIDAAQAVDWTLIAHQACFYDQAHFNKEFTAFTGFTPTDYLRLRRLYAGESERSQSLGQLPTE
jgi:methylphosphotriester-DNA--protein-cysteine methyltransferase